MASSELETKLRRRSEIIERAEAEAAADETSTLPASERPSTASSNSAKVAVQLADNPYNEFRELSRKQIQTCQKMFNRFAARCYHRPIVKKISSKRASGLRTTVLTHKRSSTTTA